VDYKKPPLVFANHVIRQTADHVVDEKVSLREQDYTSLRVVFRKMGGSWAALADGDIDSTRLLSRIVKKWGKSRKKKNESDAGD
jgi:hypothetical protein